MGCKVRLYDTGLDDLLSSPPAKRHVTVAAKEVAQAASELAPRRTGRLAESYTYTRAEETGDGLVARAYTDVPYGHLVEWGSVNNAPKAPLRRAAQRVGLRIRIAAKGT